MIHSITAILSFKQLKQQVDHTTYTRGQEIVQQKKVCHFVVKANDKDSITIDGTTEGSHSEVYVQAIVINKNKETADFSLNGFCSCPVGYNCKHVIAVLLNAMGHSDSSELPIPDPITNKAYPLELGWLSSVGTPISVASTKAAGWVDSPHQHTHKKRPYSLVFLINYALKPSPNQAFNHDLPQRLLKNIAFSAQLSQAKANGVGWLKPKPISAQTDTHWTQEQDELIRLIRMMSPYGATHYPCDIQGTTGLMTLNRILEQPLVFLTTTDNTELTTPLRRGDTLTVSWSWRCLDTNTHPDPKWCLEWSIVHPHNQSQCIYLYPGLPTLYLDITNGLIGMVDIGSLTHGRFLRLLDAPIFSTSLIKVQEDQIREVLGDIALPPVLGTITRLDNIKPSAKLRIHSVEPRDYATKDLLTVTPYFIYGEHEIIWNTSERTVLLPTISEERIMLVRDRASETVLLNSLVDLGLLSMAHRLELVDAHHQMFGHHDSNDRLAMQEWSINTDAPSYFITPFNSNLKSNFKPNFKSNLKSNKAFYQSKISTHYYHSPWLNWAADDFSVFKKIGFEVVLDNDACRLVDTVENIHISVTGNSDNNASNNISNNNISNNSILNTTANTTANDIANDTVHSQWFDLSLGVDIEGVRHNILPWLPTMLSTLNSTHSTIVGEVTIPDWMYLPHTDGSSRFIRLNVKPLHPWLSALMELVNQRPIRQFDAETLRLSRLETLRASAALGEGAVWQGATQLNTLLLRLKGLIDLPNIHIPNELQATLRPYQQQGLNWLQFLAEQGLSGILADDMGLGKTLQTLCHILVEKQSGRMNTPVLVVAPVSLMGNWAKEAAHFTPTLRVQVFHGLDRHTAAQSLIDNDVVLTSYALLSREKPRWLAVHWHIVVLDEAQNIKNANTHAAKVVSELRANQRLCLSGTPMENHLGEMWSLFHFLMPGFLYSFKQFNDFFRIPIEKNGDTERLAQLRQRITPFMLRRTKAIVAAELPPKIETISRVILTGKQADLYETIRLATETVVRDSLASQGLARSQITVLDALLKLRQVCCDPRLVALDNAKTVQQSAKLEQLMEILPDMLAEGRRILIFSQFTAMLHLIEIELKIRGIAWTKLTGQSVKREAIIEQFTSGQVPLFLISLKAGGVGLNLPQADTVIHYDPWWNPAVENQATDRAHRIGQKNTVFVYKLVAQGTIEERILALQSRKADLANSIYDGSESRKQPMFTEDDVMELLKPLNL
ncbi:MAG: hypothetical protein RL344_226 [Pseudomonadota bacterium]|jgi:superfamily II DNA or RNA helicase